MWSRFWDSFGANDTESHLSDSLSAHHLQPPALNALSPEPSTSLSQLQGFPEITPNESASMVANNEDSASLYSSQMMSRQHSRPIDDGTFAFKFTSLGGKTHRFTSASDDYELLLKTVREKIIGEHGKEDDGTDWLTLSYLDDEEDEVLITSNADVLDAVQLARKQGLDRVKLIVHDSTKGEQQQPQQLPQQQPVPRVQSPSTMTRANSSASSIVTNGKSVVERPRKRSSKRSSRRFESEEEVEREDPLFPQEFMLPAAIAFLGVVILGVFAYSQVNPRHR